MPSWKKVIVSGSDANLNSLNVINGITGSLLGTSSYASNADLLDGLNSTAFVLNSQTSSFTTTSSFNAYTSSINTYTSSLNSKTSSFATTGSNNFNGNQTITGSLLISSSASTNLTVVGNSIFTGSATISIPDTFTEIPPTALTLRNESTSVGSKVPGTSIEFWSYNTDENQPSGIYKSSYIINNPYYNQGLTFGNFPGTFKFNSYNSLGYQYTGSVVTGSNPAPIGSTVFEINNSQVSSSVAILAPSFTGNLTGTASYASNALSASYARSASLATTADVATTIAVVNNTGDATRYLVWAATGAGNRTPNITTQRFIVNSATGSMGINKSTIASGYILDVGGNALISGSLTVFSGSVIDFQVTDAGTKIGNAPSDNHTVTGSLLLSGSLTSTGTITAQTLVVQTVSSSVIYSSGSNRFGNDLANTQVLTGSVIITGSLSVNGSNAVLTNQTSSFVLNSQTSSFVQNSQTSSFATFTALNAYTSSINTYTSSLNSATGAFATFTALNAYTSSINTYTSSLNAKTSSFATTGSNNFIGTENITGSLNVSGSTTFTGTSGTTLLSTNADTLIFTGSLYTSGAASLSGSISISGSLSVNGSNVILTNQTGAFVLNSQTSSMSVLSASFAATASFALNTQNIDTGSLLLTSSFNAYTSSINSYTSSLNTATSSFVLNSQTSSFVQNSQTGAFATFTALNAYTSSLNNFSASILSYTASQNNLNGTYATTSSLNAYTSSINTYTSSLNSVTSSFVKNSQTSSMSVLSASYAATASLADTASFINVSGNALDALRYPLFVATGVGVRTANISTNRIVANGATGSLGLGKGSITSGYYLDVAGSVLISGSLVVTGSTVISSSLTVFSGSAIDFQVTDTGTKIGNQPSDNHSVTGSLFLSGSLTSTGTLTAQTLIVQTITSSVIYSSGSNVFGNSLANTQVFTGSVNITGSLNVYNGEIFAGRIDNTNEGGQVSFARALDGVNGWYIDVYGNTSTPSLRFIDVSTAAVRMTISGSGGITMGQSLAVGSINPSATVGRIDASNDVVAFSTSDIRFKENITPIPNALDKLDKIGGYTFDWKTEEKLVSLHGFKGHDVGIIAQEIESILPEVVTTRDNGYKAVKYEKIVPLLIQAIKEQQEQIKELQDIIKNK
jgi:hypothetical protein